jgi:hypothetical protein
LNLKRAVEVHRKERKEHKDKGMWLILLGFQLTCRVITRLSAWDKKDSILSGLFALHCNSGNCLQAATKFPGAGLAEDTKIGQLKTGTSFSCLQFSCLSSGSIAAVPQWVNCPFWVSAW